MQNYLKVFEKYLEKDLLVMPCARKGSVLKDHDKKETYENVGKLEFVAAKTYQQHGHCNIGVLCGELTGIVALDIDSTDQEFIKRVEQIVPPTPCGKIGNKKRGRTGFYRYDGLDTKRLKPENAKKAIIEVLSNGTLTIIPPSDHPDLKYKYEWRGESLLDVDLDELPKLTVEHVNDLQKLIDGYFGKEVKIEKNLMVEGRNNKLKSMVAGKEGDNVGLDEIAYEIFTFDEQNHRPPLFSDPSEFRDVSNPIKNCYSFVISNFKSHKSKNYNPFKNFKTIEVINEDRVANYKRKKYPKFRGIMSDFFDYIYDTSQIKRTRFTVASVLSIMSVLCGNRFHWNGIHPNLYCMLLGDSGEGKNRHVKFISDFLHECGLTNLYGEESPSSDTGIIMSLPENRVRIDVIDEAAILFGAINDKKNAYLSKMSDYYAKLFTNVGHFFGGKHTYSAKKDNDDGVIGQCYSPYVVMLCSMTINDFKNNFTQNTMDKGLGGRFLYFPDDEKKPSEFMPNRKDIPKNLILFAKSIRKLGQMMNPKLTTMKPIEKFKFQELKLTDSALESMKAFHAYADELKMNSTGKLKPIHNRVFEIFVKLVILDTISINHDNLHKYNKLKTTLESVEWARSFVNCYINSADEFLDINLSSSKQGQIFNDFEQVVKEAGHKGIAKDKLAKKYLVKKHDLDKFQRNKIIDTLLDENTIYQVKESQKTTFIHSNFIIK